MKINELAKISHVNAETIRMYRKKGLLRPRQNANGYYEYSGEDLQTLLFIRKLRGMNLSLPTIAYTCEHNDVADIIAGFQQEYDALEAQIAQLRKQQDMLRLHLAHYEAYRENANGVTEVDIPDDRYDMIFDEKRIGPEMDRWLERIDLFTQGLTVAGSCLRSDPLPAHIPVKLTVGSYLPILEEYGYPIPDEALYFPKGRYLTTKVVLGGEPVLDAEQLRPLVEYAKSHNYRLVGDATAFLFRVDKSKNGSQFIFRLRIRVEPEENGRPGQALPSLQ